MKVVNIADAKVRLSEYLRLVEEGETIVLARRNKPFAEIRPLRPPLRGLRPYGLCRGEFTVPEDFDEPLPDDILEAFEGA